MGQQSVRCKFPDFYAMIENQIGLDSRIRQEQFPEKLRKSLTVLGQRV